MPVGTKDSTLITNLEASPVSMNAVALDGGRVRSKKGTFEVIAENINDDGDILRLCRIPTNAVIDSIEIASDALGASGGTANVGLYKVDGTLLDEDAYASLITTLQAGGAMTRVENEARNIDKVGQRVWQDAGLTSDPGGLVDICITIAATMNTPAAGTVSFNVRYTVD